MYKNSAIAFIIIFFVLCVNSIHGQLIENGLVSYWSFDDSSIDGETLKDLVGGNNGKIMGDPEIVEGMVNEGLYLDGNRDYVEVPDSENLHITEELTICLWLKWISTIDDWPAIFEKGDDNGMNYYFGIWQLSNELYFTFTPAWQDRRSGLMVKDNDWSYIAVRVDGPEGILNFFVDGNVSADVALGFNELPDTDTGALIGAQTAKGADLHAVVDELCVYNRVLSDDELEQNQTAKGNAAVDMDSVIPLIWGKIKTGYSGNVR
ncbi:hypothetical protein GF312_08360 [Candidatus Poribacteria bacterium]|nr:hypothetical protein [Candidatus Poribacteria bacterium]